ncbi:MAG: DapH/DapD/GlmU-related protein [Planctomycetota bacterium]
MTERIDPSARVHPTAEVEDDVSIGPRTAVWSHAHLRVGASIGRDCIIGEKCVLGPGVRIGDLCKLNTAAFLPHGVTLETGVMVSAHVVFTNDRTPRATDGSLSELRSSDPDEHTLATVVRRGASIGANATIGPGLELGEFCMIGMGSVVTKDVPAFALAVGNPARVVGRVDEAGEIVETLGD